MVGCWQLTDPHDSPYWAHVQADSLGSLNQSRSSVRSTLPSESSSQASQAAVGTWFLDWTPLRCPDPGGICCGGEGFDNRYVLVCLPQKLCGSNYPLSIAFIVVNEFCERFSYYGMRGMWPVSGE